ncbi:nuclear transport factor 2 family protein [Asanoa sp. WMMD1127]|uniref:nuclear transport factor 2 family protein n=1 Tax=Asanoa sp. WMMD1127 TaxID=3016107 RepID=UPI002415AE21|nr:nuclear transport factor 2 family protein [Asanoa sp. WMMD1127]MDG4826985.1 nuclear transport factor 2 family protein [Asanoa sp. WMMD1127]
MSRDPERVAALFTEDGVYEAPLASVGDVFPPRMSGRAAIRDGLAAAYRRMAPPTDPVDPERTRFALHVTADPDVFIAEIDTAFASGATMSLVQIFRVRDGLIHHLRDYFAPVR